MVTFKDDGYQVYVYSGKTPFQDWTSLMLELLDLIAETDDNAKIKPYFTIQLLKEMLPDWKTVKEMSE